MADTTAVSLPDSQEVVASVFVSLLTSPGLWWHLESYRELLLYALNTKLKNVRKKVVVVRQYTKYNCVESFRNKV